MHTDPVILHCDCNGFFASVECVFRPELKLVPMAVCGDPESRHGIILAKNELAKKFGVKTAETIWQAKQKCPDLVLVPARHGAYRDFSKRVNEIYCRYTSQVEPFGIDESWLDVTASRRLFGDGPTIADRLREDVKRETGLTISVGVSFNKIFAKLGSDYKKPDATTVISRENYKQIVWPLPVSDLLFVGKSAADTLARMGVSTIGELAGWDTDILQAKLGKLGPQLQIYARGEDQGKVAEFGTVTEAKSVGNGVTYPKDLRGRDEVLPAVLALCDQVAARVRKNGALAATVTVAIKDPYFHTISRQKTMDHTSDLAREFFRTAMELIDRNWDYRQPIRAITVTASGFGHGVIGEQLSLFGGEEKQIDQEKVRRLEGAMDLIRARYGGDAVEFARSVKKED
ncbi:MAG: DNA polymerase IV [Oscillospiraceae bacterium]|nr:DNA polymerase IV [Oscillospiraceae bacterium]